MITPIFIPMGGGSIPVGEVPLVLGIIYYLVTALLYGFNRIEYNGFRGRYIVQAVFYPFIAPLHLLYKIIKEF